MDGLLLYFYYISYLMWKYIQAARTVMLLSDEKYKQLLLSQHFIFIGGHENAVGWLFLSS